MKKIARLYVTCDCKTEHFNDLTSFEVISFATLGVTFICGDCGAVKEISPDSDDYQLFLYLPKDYVLKTIGRKINDCQNAVQKDD